MKCNTVDCVGEIISLEVLSVVVSTEKIDVPQSLKATPCGSCGLLHSFSGRPILTKDGYQLVYLYGNILKGSLSQ